MTNIKKTLLTKPRHEQGETVYATNLGWCIRQEFKCKEEEVLYEYRGLLDILIEQGYDKYGVLATEADSDEDAGNGSDGQDPKPEDIKLDGAEDGTDGSDITTEDGDVDTGEDTGAGKTVETKETETTVKVPDAAVADTLESDVSVVHTRESLEALSSLKEVRAVGAKFDVNDISKAKLIDKILEAQKCLSHSDNS